MTSAEASDSEQRLRELERVRDMLQEEVEKAKKEEAAKPTAMEASSMGILHAYHVEDLKGGNSQEPRDAGPARRCREAGDIRVGREAGEGRSKCRS